ncbi:glycyl radical protein [Chloroflexota bacterium]
MSTVQKLRETLLQTEPKLSCERLYYLMEAYKETEGQPTPSRRANFFNKLLCGMTIFIDENPIVGTLTKYPSGIQPYPEYSCDWMPGMADSLANSGSIAEEDRKLLTDAVDYWRDKGVFAGTRAAFSQRYAGEINCEELVEARILNLEMINLNSNRVNLDFGKVLNKGLEGVIAEAEEELKKLPFGPLDTYHRGIFLNSVIIACNAVIKFAQRYSTLARDMAQQEKIPERKRQLEMIAETCQQVPAKPARTFYEAIQSFWFTHLAAQIEHTSVGRGVGRFAQYMYPLYKRDIDKGVITREEAIELLELLFIKFSEIGTFVAGHHLQSAYSKTGVVFQKISLGGVTPTGDDATNEMDYLLLEAQSRLRLPDPPLEVFYHDKLPHEFLLKCAELVATGIGMPAFFNNDIIIQHWLDHGASLEDARNCCVVGCVDTISSHTTGTLASGDINMPKLLELALNNGKDPISGKQLGPQTGEAVTFKSYEELREALIAQLQYFMPLQVQSANISAILKAEIAPAVFASALVDDCIKNGKGVLSGGGRYRMDYGTVLGMIDVADSLSAIKKLVFEEKSITMSELLKALGVDFKGYERLHQMLLETPKYGNDDDYVDGIAKDLYNLFLEEHQKHKDHLNRIRSPRGITMALRFSSGVYVGALPSGRKSGIPLAEGSLCPETGMDTKGPTALLHSATKVLDNVKYAASMLNMKFHPSSLKDKQGLEKLIAFLKTYMDLGGNYVQFTVADTDTLRDAQIHPENYGDLLVAGSGLSGFYTNLSARLQNEIINKTEFKLD